MTTHTPEAACKLWRQLGEELGETPAFAVAEAIEAPVLNINGSSGERLIEDHLAALTQLQAAESALAACAPHPRDWQTDPSGDVHYAKARREHFARRYALAAVRHEIEAVALKIQDQGARRARTQREVADKK
jgi:hypothetical protein